MSKLFSLDTSVEDAEAINLSFSDVLAMEARSAELDGDVLSLEELLTIYDSSVLTVESLEIDLLSLESKETVAPVVLNAINARYITACANTGCTPVSISVEDGSFSSDLSVEGISDVLGKMKKAIITIIKKIMLAMQKLYVKILVALNDDDKKAKLLLAEFVKHLDNNIIEPSESNWRLTDDARNALFANLSAMMFFREKDELISITFSEFTDPRYNLSLMVDESFERLQDLKIGYVELGPMHAPIGGKINDFLRNPIEFKENLVHICTMVNGSSFGVLTLVHETPARDNVIDLKYQRHSLKGMEAGHKVKSNYRNNGYVESWDEDFRIMPDLNTVSLRSIADKIATTSSAIKTIQETHIKSTKGMEDLLKSMGDSEDNKEAVKALQKIILIQQQISTDQMLGLIKMNKAGLKLLTLQSYNFKK